MSGVNGNATGRTQTGRPYRSRPRDCRTVRVRHPGKPMLPDCPHSRRRKGRPNRKSHWSGITISRGRTPLNLRIVHLFVISADCGHAIWRKNSGKARRTRSCPLRVRGTVSQETCHPQGPRLRKGVRPIQGEILPMPARRLLWLHHPVPRTARFVLPRTQVCVVQGLASCSARAEAGIIP
jgi:hypothetical protein